MAKELQVISWCDGLHGEDEKPTPADTEHTIQLDGSRVKVLDLCLACEATLLGPLTELVANAPEVGKPLPRAKKKKAPAGVSSTKAMPDGRTVCPLCGEVSVSRQGMGQHLKAHHETGFGKLRDEGIEVVSEWRDPAEREAMAVGPRQRQTADD